jgi:2-polyprenyl-3-methyl-5-hydroxy-6-metoxy-1,4-benzoquinol methylase
MMTMDPRSARHQNPSWPAGERRRTRPACVICGQSAESALTETCEVTSNVRAFTTERFRLWRCGGCRSIHARDEVDLAHYYSRYPFFDLPMDWRLRFAYKEQLRRLEAAGIKHHHRILDYGCGSGAFLRYLAECGYADAVGFDGYNPLFSHEDVLRAEYDCVLSQDVLEHVAEPQALLDRFHRLTKPGGLIAIGTPNASAIDLTRAEEYRHALHAPYHRHIFSKPALLAVGAPRGWSFVQYYATQYANTPVPVLNSPFYLFFMRTQDDTLDCLLEQPPQLGPVLAQLPAALFWGMCGSYRAEETDVMVIFRRT